MKIRRSISLFLAVIMCFITTIPVWADSRATSSNITAVSIETIDCMTNAERNEFISTCASNLSNSRMFSTIDYVEVMKLCWYAAGKILESYYPCTGKLIQCSAYGENYTETNGSFSAAILRHSDYKIWRTSEPAPALMSFGSGDLFLALHTVTISITSQNISYGTIHVYDYYDFDPTDPIANVLLNLINDWAWLSQKCGYLTAISINIYFDDNNLAL